MSSIRMSTKWNDPSCIVFIVTDSPVLIVCTLASRPVRYPDWLETNVECRVLDMRTWWRLANVNLSRHCKTGSAFFGVLHQLGYWWHCLSSLSLMALHTRFLAFCCTSASAYTRDKVTINVALTCMTFYMWRHI